MEANCRAAARMSPACSQRAADTERVKQAGRLRVAKPPLALDGLLLLWLLQAAAPLPAVAGLLPHGPG